MMERCVFAIVITALCVVQEIQPSDDNLPSTIDLKTTLECHRRQFTLKATRTDPYGRNCSDYLRVNSCWGRCDSYEIPDWRFPYKISSHPVCMHETARIRRVVLRECDYGVEPEYRIYEYVEAETCSCNICNSSWASCEAPHEMSKRSLGPVLSSLSPSSLVP